MKTEKLCARCKMLPAAKGKTKCLNCLDYEAAAQMKYFYNLPDEERQRQIQNRANRTKRIRAERKANGICTKCGKRKPTGGFFTCEICRARDKQRRLSYAT